MNKRWIRGLGAAVIASAVAVPAWAIDHQPMVFSINRGELDIQQDTPCDHVSQTTPVVRGLLEITPATGIDVLGNKQFVLTRVTVVFAPFSISGSCAGISRTLTYSDVGVQLGQTATLTGVPTSTPGVFTVTIPRDRLFIAEGVIVDAGKEQGLKRPMQDVIATIDLVNGRAQLAVVMATKVNFAAFGFDISKLGTLTATLSAVRVFPDSDGDNVTDDQDNCRLTPNATQSLVTTPVLVGPPAITIASCSEHRLGRFRGVDICNNTLVQTANNAPATFVTGDNRVTWTAVDQAGRRATATQTLTVVDATPPVFMSMPPDLTLNTCRSASLGTPIAVDDCAGGATLSNNAPPKFGQGQTIVTWTATDGSQNRSTATQLVTVADSIAPTAACVAVGPAPIVPGSPRTFRVGATDACVVPTIAIGSYALTHGEGIVIEPGRNAGVTFLGTGADGLRRFLVGPTDAFITATDASHNVATAACR